MLTHTFHNGLSLRFVDLVRETESDAKSSFLRTSRQLGGQAFCSNQQESLRLAIRCNDETELLVCAGPEAVTGNSNKYCSNPKKAWTDQQCQNNGGFDMILPYYSGCYPNTEEFWNSYAPGSLDETNLSTGKGGGNTCQYDIPVPPLDNGIKNLNFEDEAMGLDEWAITEIDSDGRYVLTRKATRFSAYEGSHYAWISAGHTHADVTDANSIVRDDFRLPEFDETCVEQLQDVGVATDYCLVLARRFLGFDGRNDDVFTIEFTTLDEAGTVLFEESIGAFDVGGRGGDSGWQVLEAPLPTNTPIGSKTFGRLSVSMTNVGNSAFDSVGLIDDIKIAPCSK